MSRTLRTLDRLPATRSVPSFTESFIEPLTRLRGEVDRLFDDFPAPWSSARFNLPQGLLIPAVDMTATKKAFKLTVEVPGMDATDIDMHVHDGAIFISGEKKERRDDEEEAYSYSERSYGSFERRIELPQGSDEKGIKAKVHNGILEITVPKMAEAAAKRQRIEIEPA